MLDYFLGNGCTISDRRLKSDKKGEGGRWVKPPAKQMWSLQKFVIRCAKSYKISTFLQTSESGFYF